MADAIADAQRVDRIVWLEPYGLVILISLLIVLPLLGAQLGIDLSVVSRPGAWRQHSPGRVLVREACALVHSKAHCQGTVVNADESANWNELHAASK
jgi:hypothetical protein